MKSLVEMSKEYGFYVRTARNQFPELCNEVDEMYNHYLEESLIYIERKLEEALKYDVPIGKYDFCKKNDIRVYYIDKHFPNLSYKLVERYRSYKGENNCLSLGRGNSFIDLNHE